MKNRIINKKKNQRYCNICFKTIHGGAFCFKAHLHLHGAIKPRFKCFLCSQEFFRADVYTHHMKAHAGNVNKTYFVCDYCDRNFVNKTNLILHLKIHDDSLNSHRYECVACRIEYTEERSLIYHIRKTHFNLDNKEPLYLSKKMNETWIEPIMDSDICVQMTKRNNNVIIIKKSDKILNKTVVVSKPKLLEKDLVKNQYFKSIYACNSNTQYSRAVCEYCDKVMLKKSITSHIRERHLKIRKFKCKVCTRTFKRRYQLADHTCSRILKTNILVI